MHVILLKKVENLGNLGDKVHVKPGFGRNFLIPTGRAVAATAANTAAFEARRAELEQASIELLKAAETRKLQLDGLTVAIPRRAGDEGRLFGSVGASDIAAAVQAAGFMLEKQEVRLSQGPLRSVGEYMIAVRLHSEVDANLKIEVIAEV